MTNCDVNKDLLIQAHIPVKERAERRNVLRSDYYMASGLFILTPLSYLKLDHRNADNMCL